MAQLSVRSRSLLASAALALLSFACGGDGTENLTPATVEAAVATTQTDTVGKPVAITPAVVVKASNGKPVSGVAVTFVMSGASGAALGTETATTGKDGKASVGSWTLGTTTGIYRVTATVASLTPPTNAVVFNATAVADAPAKMVFVTQPGSSGVNAPISEIQVQLTDQYGNLVTTSGVPITLVIGTNPGSGTIGGTVTQNTVNGAASFTNITISALGNGYTLVATSPGLVSATSNTFTIAAARIVGQLTLSSSVTLLDAPGGANGNVGRTIAASAAPRVGFDQAGVRALSKPARTGRRAYIGAAATSRRYTKDELIVTFRESALGGQASAAAAGRSVAAAQSAARTMRARLEAFDGELTTKGVSPALRAARVVVDPSEIDAVAARLRQDPAVESVARNELAHVELEHRTATMKLRPATPAAPAAVSTMLAPTATTTSNDTYRTLQSWNYGMIDLPQAWTITTGSQSVVVAVVDNGIRFDHPDIAANLTSDGYDFVSSDMERLCGTQTQVDLAGDGDGYDPDPTTPVIYSDSTDAQDNLVCVERDTLDGLHGLHVAGTIGAVGNNGSGVSGVNWAVKIRPIRALNSLGSGTFYDIAQGVLYAAGLPADNGKGGTVTAAGGRAPIINMSLGGPSNVPVLSDAINRAVAAGSLVIVAAGNENSSQPSYPAAYDNVISVASIGPDRLRASYSNFGPTVDIAAPGGDICDEGTGTAANPCAGVRNGTFGIWSTDWDYGSSPGPLFSLNHGTSMAAPHVSGVAALLLAHEPGLTASQLRSRLLDYAVDAGAPGRDDIYGFGILNARNSLTQSLAPARQLFAALYDATTGARVRTQRVDNTGQYQFNDIGAGSYRVYAGQDEGNDLQSDPGRRWSAYAPGSHTGKPATIVIAGGEQSASFEVGFPSEQEANNSTSTADVLPVGGYLQSTEDATDVDWYRINITTAGTYTIETVGIDGACGFAMEEDTDATLFQSDGATQLARNDDISTGGLSWCSRITTSLAAGTYYLRVQASSSTTKTVGSISAFPQIRVGRYRVQLRSGT